MPRAATTTTAARPRAAAAAAAATRRGVAAPARKGGARTATTRLAVAEPAVGREEVQSQGGWGAEGGVQGTTAAAAHLQLRPGAISEAALHEPAVRRLLAREFGFDQIGKPVPDEVRLQDVVKTLPAEVFEFDEWKAWRTVAVSLSSMAASLWLISVVPNFLLPVAWFIAGTAFTGFFVVGHDCGHKTFSRNKLLEDVVGLAMMAPLIYPFEPWRLKHNVHHAFTNMLEDDTAWHPVMREEWESWPRPLRAVLGVVLGSPLKLFASIGHWMQWHFNLSLYSEKQRPKVLVSLAVVAAFMGVGWPLLIAKAGWWGWFKYWFMPWVGYHFWMSTFTLVHHTAPHIPFKARDDGWDAAKAQLGGTVHCEFPRWIEFLCHDISVHIPHHVSTKIPSYHLRAAHQSLVENWGEHLNITSLPKHWRLLQICCSDLHFYDGASNYAAFDAPKPRGSPLLRAQRWLSRVLYRWDGRGFGKHWDMPPEEGHVGRVAAGSYTGEGASGSYIPYTQR